jgi:hypothetical protein
MESASAIRTTMLDLLDNYIRTMWRAENGIRSDFRKEDAHVNAEKERLGLTQTDPIRLSAAIDAASAQVSMRVIVDTLEDADDEIPDLRAGLVWWHQNWGGSWMLSVVEYLDA